MSLLLSFVLLQASALVSGRVVDASGGLLAHAALSITCNDFRYSTATDATGQFRVDGLPAALCHVTASMDGFVTSRRTVDLTAQSSAALDIRLVVKPFASQIVVTPFRGEAQDTADVAQAATRV